MAIGRAERETIIRKADDEDRWHVFSQSPPMIRRLRKFLACPDAELIEQSKDSIEVLVPRAWVKIRPVKRRSMTQQARKAAGERLRKARQNRQNA